MSLSKTVKIMKDTTKILNDLRALMKNLPNNQGQISAYIIPTDDAHQSEYICQRDERRRFLTGFTGSAGTAVVTATQALLWTDGRYYLQATKELDSNWTLMKDGLPTTPTIEEWLSKHFTANDVIGADGNLLSSRIWRLIYSELDRYNIAFKSIEPNLIDSIWTDQPSRACNKIIALSTSLVGKTTGDKVNEIRAEMMSNKAEILVVTALDEVAWFLNLRGSDIEYNPVFFAYVVITLNDIYFFVDKTKLPDNYETHFTENGIDVILQDYSNIKPKLNDLISNSSSKVWIWLGSCHALAALVPAKRLHVEVTPIAKLKAVKNRTEANGLRNCHIRDGIALCKYFAWLENAINNGEYVTEISGATKLEEFRKKLDKFMGLSFSTISSSGPNGSVIHYHPEESTNRQITKDEIYLCDSGAQFLDGTTDVTRTWHFGTPTEYQKDCYTRVLKGQIGFGTTVFPRKVKGQVLDTIARKSLWDVGLDYRHGTGHGIGHFLNVHEGPMGVGIRSYPDDPGLQENMFLSNEPGYYEDGEFGLRIEDIVQIVPGNVEGNFNGRGSLSFETVTMCPIQTKMIKIEMLTEKERNHLNSYHQKVYNTISAILEKDADNFTIEWLKKKTKPI